MITTLNIKCPHCEQVSQVFLSTTVCVIILNCPSCLSPIMYFRRKIFLLDPRQLKKISGNTQESVVIKLLEQICGAEATASLSPKKAVRSAHIGENGSFIPIVNKVAVETRAECSITEDDCTNLRIELELCTDSQKFIDRL